MKRSKLVLMFLSLILTLVLGVYITFAWFDMIRSTKPVLIEVGSLKLSSSFYLGYDDNNDGIIDDYEEITEGGIRLTKVVPGKTYNFRIVARNEGSVDGFLTIVMNDIIISDKDILSGYSVIYTDPNTLDEENKSLLLAAGKEKYKLELFSDYVLESKGTFIFDFKIVVREDYRANWGGQTLTISNYIIRLVQAHQ